MTHIAPIVWRSIFPHLPASFDSLMIPPDFPREPAELGRRAFAVFEEMEGLLYSHGLDPYEKTLDSFVRERPVGERIWHRLRIDRVARIAKKIQSSLILNLASER
jgi:hypothetical protein